MKASLKLVSSLVFERKFCRRYNYGSCISTLMALYVPPEAITDATNMPTIDWKCWSGKRGRA